ncbi:MAG: class I SAM-dependent methyltransferase, partial [Anaerolineales bacterium]
PNDPKKDIMQQKITYSTEPENKAKFTAQMDKFYSVSAGIYDFIVKVLPTWRNWVKHALPYIEGPRVLEVSFGTGYLLTQYADRFETHGIDYNANMVATAKKNLARKGITSDLSRGNVESLPYEDNSFDTVVNTMAFTGYPDARKALSELHRVLKPGGKLVMVDIAYPQNGNWLGVQATKFWIAFGDLVRDMGKLFQAFNFETTGQEIGGFGSVHLYIAKKC